MIKELPSYLSELTEKQKLEIEHDKLKDSYYIMRFAQVRMNPVNYNELYNVVLSYKMGGLL